MAYLGKRVIVVIPAVNEEQSIGSVIRGLPPEIDVVIVGNNGSTDSTEHVATEAGAVVVTELEPGYGAACLKALEEAARHSPDVILFIDGDFADDPAQALEVLHPVCANEADMCIGSRALGESERGSLTPVQSFGNWLSTSLIRLFWNERFTDLGPFRSISWPVLQEMKMVDRNYGWTVEMQIKAAKMKIRNAEVPVRYRKRIGESKVSGTIKGSVMAGTIILTTIARHVFR